MKEIIVRVDETGFVLGVFVSPDIADANVGMIDFRTDDPKQLEAAKDDDTIACQRVKDGDLVWLPFF